MKTTIAYRASFLSEWHVGSGRGRPGDVDRLVKRRRHTRLPYLPAKSLTGVWRWAAEEVAVGLDAGRPDRFNSELVRALFGDTPAEDAAERRRGRRTPARRGRPRPAALSIRPADFDAAVARSLVDRGLAPFTTMVVNQTAIDTQSGSAAHGSLRRTEVTRRGSVLHGEFTIDADLLSSDRQSRAIALIVVAAARVTRIGGKRRRGFGALRLDLEVPTGWLPTTGEGARDQEVPEILAWALQYLGAEDPSLCELRLPVSTAAPASISADAEGLTATDRSLETVELTITSLERLVIEDVVIGNVTRTLDYIPGASLLPIVTSVLRAHAIDPAPLIDQSRLIVRSAHPEVDGRRGIPVPLSFAEPKTPYDLHGERRAGMSDGGGGVVNLLVGDDPPTAQQYRQVRSGWVADDDLPGTSIRFRPRLETEIETMNTIDDWLGRTSSAVGGVYSYETIGEGERFRTEVVAPRSVATLLRDHFASGQEDRVGSSKKDDFGRVTITSTPAQNTVATVHDKAKVNGAVVSTFTLWCVSPLLASDGAGRPITNLADLKDQLGRRLASTVEVDEASAPTPASWSRPFRSESWKTKWGLPNASVVGVSAGSVARFRITGPPVGQAALDRLALEGLGGRRPAGFGEIRVDHAIVTSTAWGRGIQAWSPDLMTGSSPSATPTDAEPDAFVAAAEMARWRDELRRRCAVLTLSAVLGADPPKWMSPSQLGNYRDACSQIQSPGDVLWLPRKLRDGADALSTVVSRPDRVFDVIGIPPPPGDRDDGWREALHTLIDAAVRNSARGIGRREEGA